MKRLVALAALLVALPATASLEDDGVWQGGLWSPTVWEDGVWYEGAPVVSPDGALETSHVSPGSVPGTAVYRAGRAYAAADGAMYVAACSAPGSVVYLGGIAHSVDGALCIDTAGTIYTDRAGYPLTAVGEVVADECTPDFTVQGVPRLLSSLAVCMTNVD